METLFDYIVKPYKPAHVSSCKFDIYHKISQNSKNNSKSLSPFALKKRFI